MTGVEREAKGSRRTIKRCNERRLVDVKDSLALKGYCGNPLSPFRLLCTHECRRGCGEGCRAGGESTGLTSDVQRRSPQLEMDS